MSYSKGIFWLDDCRIPTDEMLGREQKSSHNYAMLQGGYNDGFWDNTKGLGRFTPNLLVCDDMLNDGIIHKSGKVKPHHKRNKTMGEYQGNAYGKFNNVSPDLNYDAYYGDKGSNSRYYSLDLWFNKMINNL